MNKLYSVCCLIVAFYKYAFVDVLGQITEPSTRPNIIVFPLTIRLLYSCGFWIIFLKAFVPPDINKKIGRTNHECLKWHWKCHPLVTVTGIYFNRHKFRFFFSQVLTILFSLNCHINSTRQSSSWPWQYVQAWMQRPHFEPAHFRTAREMALIFLGTF